MTTFLSRADKSILGQWWWTIDRSMLAALMMLVIFGIVMVATASPPVAERIGLSQFHFLLRHLILLGPALALMLGMSILQPQTIWRAATIIFAGGIAAMVLVLFVGMEIKGAQRWLHLPGFSLQPSEFVKPAFAVTAAWVMALQKENPDFPGNKIAAGLYLLVIILLLLQPDLGMTIVTTAIFGTQIFLAGFPMLWLVLFGGLGVALAGGSYFMFDHVKSRIDRFLNPESGDTYQVDKALDAFQSGGIFGVGPGQGTIKLDIPDAHADFIFAVAGEELGLFFIFIMMMLFAFVFLRGLSRLSEMGNMFSILAVGGILAMFGLQTLIHMGSNLHLLPAKGMTLPFISYGGSSLLSIAFSMGIVLGLTKRQRSQTIAKSGYRMKVSKKDDGEDSL